MRKSAFTLIELLVVIAIIAILAAILFPVFAQAKESAKKTAALSQTKQLNTAAVIYMADYDDIFPVGITQRNPAGTWRYNNLHPRPYNSWIGGGWDAPGVPETVMPHWGNAIEPYVKSLQMQELPAQVRTAIPAGFSFRPGVPQVASGVNFNGHLQFLSSSQIEQPSVVPLIWSAGNGANFGFAVSRPTLRCTLASSVGDGACRFNPGGPAMPGLAAGNQSFFAIPNSGRVWNYQKGNIFGHTDTSAKFKQTGFATAPALVADPFSDPYAQVNAQGTSFSYWGCELPDGFGPGTGYRYVCFFRPDRTK
jgi:prepilin-type N-terminal cleavage/methylation domain-containing protein